VLLQSVECKFGFIVDEDFQGLRNKVNHQTVHQKWGYPYISHEFLACNPNFLCQSCRKHHNLFMMGGCSEDFLNVTTHVWEAMLQLDDLVAKQFQGK